MPKFLLAILFIVSIIISFIAGIYFAYYVGMKPMPEITKSLKNEGEFIKRVLSKYSNGMTNEKMSYLLVKEGFELNCLVDNERIAFAENERSVNKNGYVIEWKIDKDRNIKDIHPRAMLSNTSKVLKFRHAKDID